MDFNLTGQHNSENNILLCLIMIMGSFAKLSSSWLVQSSLAELRFVLYLIITSPNPTPTPRIVVISIEMNRLLAAVRV